MVEIMVPLERDCGYSSYIELCYDCVAHREESHISPISNVHMHEYNKCIAPSVDNHIFNEHK